MLKKRLVTVLTFNDGVLFRTKQFEPDYRYTLSFVDAWSVDEVVAIDVTRPGHGKRGTFLSVIEQLASRCFVPLTVGGGIQSTEDISTFLRSGADKVLIGSAGFRNEALINQSAELYGSQCLVAAVDARLVDGSYRCFVDQGRTEIDRAPDQLARRFEMLGAGEILLQSIDRDGSLEGYDNTLNRLVADTVNIPVLVCGGAGRWDHFVTAFVEGHAAAACTNCIYHFTETSILSAKRTLLAAGIDVRTE